MKSVRIHSYGGLDAVRIEEAGQPIAGPGELLVRVTAAAINPVDIQISEGKHQQWLPHSFPLTLGCDVSGIVESGEGFERGAEIYAYLNLDRLGAFAEYAIVKVNEAALAPATLDPVHRAAVPVAALTAWQALFDEAKLEFGQTILVHRASGGIGSMAVQLAKWKGAHVIATASEANREYVAALGADEFLDYKTVSFDDEVRDVDVVLDTLGGDAQDRSFTVLKSGGILVSIVAPPSQEKAQAAQVRAIMMSVQPDGTRLAEISQMFDDGRLKTLVENVFPLDEARAALDMSAKGRVRGKIVLAL